MLKINLITLHLAPLSKQQAANVAMATEGLGTTATLILDSSYNEVPEGMLLIKTLGTFFFSIFDF